MTKKVTDVHDVDFRGKHIELPCCAGIDDSAEGCFSEFGKINDISWLFSDFGKTTLLIEDNMLSFFSGERTRDAGSHERKFNS